MINSSYSYQPILPKTNSAPNNSPMIKQSVNPQPMTPVKYYPIEGMKVQFTPTVKNTANVIYVFKDLTNNKRYNGLTKQLVAKRHYQHLNKAKLVQAGKEKGTKFHKALASHPDNFVVGIYPLDTTTQSLGELEKTIITLKDSVNNGYNSNSGGAEGPKKTPINKELFV